MSDAIYSRAAILLAAGAAALSPAYGQEAPAATAAPEAMDTVTVTGSRIQRDFASDSPVVSVGAESLAETGSTSVETLLNQLPQFVPSVTTTSNNPSAGGQAYVDLRGLGTQRNLVLLNGRRLPPSSALGTVDINIVPAALIDRIEVVTGGASAVYGSDAIAGVTNFVLKRHFEGVELESSYGQTTEQDGAEWSASMTMGANFADDRGNAVLSFQYTDREMVLQGDRDFSQVALDVRQQGSAALGSPTFEEGRYNRASTNSHTQAAVDQIFGAYGTPAGTVPRGQSFGFNPDGTLFAVGTGDPNSVVNFRGNTDAPGFNSSTYSYNFAPINALSLPVQRWNLAGFSNLDLSEHVEAYAQVFFTHYDVATQIAPVPAGNLLIPVTNPYVPDDLRTLLDSRPDPTAPFTFSQRMTGIGPRITRNTYDVYQLLGGVRGDLGSSWHWDAYAATARMTDTTVQDNDVTRSRMQQLLDSPTGGIGNSEEAQLCAGGYNPFLGADGLSPECADYARAYFTNRTTLEHSMMEATVNGKAFAMPAGEAQFSLGVSWREERYTFNPDLAIIRGEAVGFTQDNRLEGDYNSTELFGELYLPLLEGKRFAKMLGVTLGTRFADHSSSGSMQAHKVEGTWQPFDAFRLRASYQHAVRAPSISELFLPSTENFPAMLEDPCDIAAIGRTYGENADVANGGNDAIRNLCVAQGIPVADIDSFNSGANTQIQTFGGGNANLKEERASTFTFGVVMESPASGMFENLRASVDYYSIDLKDAIFSIPAGEVLLLCYGFAGNNPALDSNDPACQAINRRTTSLGSPSDGTPWIPSSGTDNVSKLSTSGIDTQIDWGFGLGSAGQLDLNLLATWLHKWEVQYLPSIAPIDFTGTIGDQIGSALPDYKLFFNAHWSRGPLGVGLRARFLPSMDNKYASYDPNTTVGASSITYIDANTVWAISDKVNVRVGVENLTDETPPLYTGSIQMNTDPSTYDVLGRRYYVRMQIAF